MIKSILITQLVTGTVLLLVYIILFRKSRQFIYNRIVLLTGLLMSTLLPFISFNVFPKEVVIIDSSHSSLSTLASQASFEIFTLESILIPLYWVGVGVMILLFLVNFFFLLHAIRKGKKIKDGVFTLLQGDYKASSFFHFIFFKEEDRLIVMHEKGHAHFKHSIDRMIVVLISIFNWYNPFVYFFRKLIIENHEYEADEFVIKEFQLSNSEYAEVLLSQAKQVINPLIFINQFNSSIKNRLIMLLNQTTTKKTRYLFVLPVIICLFSAFTFKSYPVYISNTNEIRDTIPGNIYFIDTVNVFDTETSTERTLIVRNEAPAAEYLAKLKLSGRNTTLIDTVFIFDSDIGTETVEEIRYTFPIEFAPFYNDMTPKQQGALINQYGQKTQRSLTPKK